MSEEYYNLTFVKHDLAFITGYHGQDETLRQVTPEELERIWDFNERREREEQEFLKGLINEG